MLIFEYPYLLLLFVLFVIAAIWFKPRNRAIIFPHLHLLEKQTIKIGILVSACKWLGVLFLVVALASPVQENTQSKDNKGYNICLVLDASLSMSQGGFNSSNFRQDRFSVVKEIVGDFIDKRVNDNLSIVVFGDFSFVALPLSFDKKMASNILSTLQIGMAGRQTAIYDALAQSINSLNVQQAKKKIAILLTDGQNTAGEVPYSVAMRMAKEHNVTVYSVAIGSRGEFDTSVLEEMSRATGGKFFLASNSNSLLRIYKQIDELEKYDIKANTFIQKDYFYSYPLFLSILFLLFYILLVGRRSLV